MTHLKSRVLSTGDYDETSHTLTLTFQNGTMYTYQDVPSETFQELIRAESAGQFFQSMIRPNFHGTKVEV